MNVSPLDAVIIRRVPTHSPISMGLAHSGPFVPLRSSGRIGWPYITRNTDLSDVRRWVLLVRFNLGGSVGAAYRCIDVTRGTDQSAVTDFDCSTLVDGEGGTRIKTPPNYDIEYISSLLTVATCHDLLTVSHVKERASRSDIHLVTDFKVEYLRYVYLRSVWI